jgi:hypothetical protein
MFNQELKTRLLNAAISKFPSGGNSIPLISEQTIFEAMEQYHFEQLKSSKNECLTNAMNKHNVRIGYVDEDLKVIKTAMKAI